MTSAEYFKHARTLGAFRAQDVIELAREAAEMDRAAAAKPAAPVCVSYESLPDGSDTIRFSREVTVY